MELNKAPWTPPGWVFGMAWTVIMVCFSMFLNSAYSEVNNTKVLIGLFAFSWVLNVAWNPIFFYMHNLGLGMVVITSLTLLIAFMIYQYWPEMKLKTLLLLPYVLWLIIATSLNGYILANN